MSLAPAEVERVLADLAAWGLVERAAEGAPRLTRRWRGAAMRAAAVLQQEEKEGRARPGHPIRRMAEQAFAELALAPPGVDREPYVTVLSALALDEMPKATREFLGL